VQKTGPLANPEGGRYHVTVDKTVV